MDSPSKPGGKADRRKSKRGALLGVFLTILILSAVVLKLLLTGGSLLLHSKPADSLLSISEVAAGEGKSAETPPSLAEKSPALASTSKSPLHSAAPTLSLASSLEEKQQELARKEQLLQERERHLAEMEKDVQSKIQELIGIQKDIQSYRNEKAEAQNANTRSLSQIYGTMKPKEASKLLENMDEGLAVTIISSMKPNEAAAILACMDLKKAAKISEALTKR